MLARGAILGGEIWEEPVRGETFPPHLLGLSGIEQLRLFLDGKAAPPPVGHLTGTYLTEVGVGSATFVMPITGWLQIPTGLMTAGGVAILADGPLGCAIQSALPPATGYATSELSINMVRPVPGQGQRAVGDQAAGIIGDEHLRQPQAVPGRSGNISRRREDHAPGAPEVDEARRCRAPRRRLDRAVPAARPWRRAGPGDLRDQNRPGADARTGQR